MLKPVDKLPTLIGRVQLLFNVYSIDEGRAIMNLGNKLLNLRKKEGLSQEEVADRLGVSRQTISKWETDQSLPDFDKILPLCNLYNITANELLTGREHEEKKCETLRDGKEEEILKKRAQYIGLGVLFYFISIAWFMVGIPFLKMDPTLVTAIFLIICGIGTYLIIYTNIVHKPKKSERKIRHSSLQRKIIGIITLGMTCIYLYVSFMTFAWHITWILWIVNAIIIEIVRLVFSLKGASDEK